MAAADTAPRPQGLRSTLSFAGGELCVIVLLYVAALSSYVATRLARLCGLTPPCFLCSRLDHALHGKDWFSVDLVCAAHRSEISAVAYCRSHDQLARSGDLCRRCRGDPATGAGEEGGHSRSRCSCCSEPAFLAGIEEGNESDDSPRSRDKGSSAIAAKPAAYRSAAPTRIAVDRNLSAKNTFIGRANLTSPRPSEIISARESNSTTQQEVKALLSQMSTVRGLDTSSSEGAPSPSPGINLPHTEESNAAATATSRAYLERNYSVLEPSDGSGSLADDAEGEGSLESVKRQLELNRKAMAALYKELEEERSASAIAASQTMAMINRLQEEKAAMQMEALQYLRMMEEQADHDHQAIQDLHDLLTEREKELLDMDAELSSCRRLLEDEHEPPFNGGRTDADGEAVSSTVHHRNVGFDEVSGVEGSAMSYFEDERASILEYLGRLEESLCASADRLASDGAENKQDNDENERVGENHEGKSSCVTNEVSLLSKRLKALEADQQFLKQVLGSLKCGSDGLQCVQEITNHLAELRWVAAQQTETALP